MAETSDPQDHTSSAEMISSQTYFDSPEAIVLFAPREDETVLECIDKLVEILTFVNNNVDGWRHVVEGGDPDKICTPNQIFEIRHRCAFLCLALQLAKENMNKMNWFECCQVAAEQLNKAGMMLTKNGRTIQRWHREFRASRRFPHPNPNVMLGKKAMPPFLEAFPEMVEQLRQFCMTNLPTLSIEKVHGFIHEKALPARLKEWNETQTKNGHPQEDISQFIGRYGLKNVSITTTWRWMHHIGLSYSTRKKSYYVDGHEREDVVVERVAFCKRYLTQYEPRCLRWSILHKRQLANLILKTMWDIVISIQHPMCPCGNCICQLQ